MACLSGGLLVAPLAATTPSARNIPRVGYVTSNARSINVDAFEQGLHELGYVMGQNVVVEYRFGEGRVDQVQAYVDELLRLGIIVLFAANPYVIRAARQSSTAIPIVGIDLETDPVQAGWVKNLTEPSGNDWLLSRPPGAQHEAAPVPGRGDATSPADRRPMGCSDRQRPVRALQRTAPSVRRFRLQSLAFRETQEFAVAFETARHLKAQALVLLSSPAVFLGLNRIADLALQYHLPAIGMFPQFAAAGGMMGYGPDLTDLFRQAARYVDRILKGAKPADLPIQRPTTFKLAINLKTAKGLG